MRRYIAKHARAVLVRLLKDTELFAKPFKKLIPNVFEIRDLNALKAAMKWEMDPVVEGAHLNDFTFLGDINFRRIRDAEVIGVVCRNSKASIILEIGTSYGYGTALIAQNAPDASIYTVNMLPQHKDEAGKYITIAPEKNEIGRFYRQQGYKNIEQIYANTLTWEPDFRPIDVAFIDGSHDKEFVFNDTRKVLKNCQPGSIILWHDFAPQMVDKFHWIHDVCLGIERLYRERLISGPILHVMDSWVGLYVVQKDDILS